MRTFHTPGMTAREMAVSPIRIVGLILGAFALGSCSYVYTVRAVMIDGKLAFIVDPASGRGPECVNDATVAVDRGETARATPALGDAEGLVENGVFWWTAGVSGCEYTFPLFYGHEFNGEPRTLDDGPGGLPRGYEPSVVAAKPLRRGVVYEVSTVSGSTGYGGGFFRITADGHVENWSEDPTPTVHDADRYAVKTEYVPPLPTRQPLS